MKEYKRETVSKIISLVNKNILLPDIQRPFVWDEQQVYKLFDSLMRGYPISTFLFWDLTIEQLEATEKKDAGLLVDNQILLYTSAKMQLIILALSLFQLLIFSRISREVWRLLKNLLTVSHTNQRRVIYFCLCATRWQSTFSPLRKATFPSKTIYSQEMSYKKQVCQVRR